MPILNSAYLSNLNVVYFNGYIPARSGSSVPLNQVQKYLLLENFSQVQTNDVKPQYMIQGTLGTRITDVGGITWKTSLKSPAIFFESSTNYRDTYGDALDVLIDGWNNTRVGGNYCSFLLEKGTLEINKEGVTASVSLKHDPTNAMDPAYSNFAVPGGFELRPNMDRPVNGNKDQDFANFIARNAKWYDCYLYISNLFYDQAGVPELIFGIENATINYTTNIGEKYFVGVSNQFPTYVINSYMIEASFTLVTRAQDFYKFIQIYGDTYYQNHIPNQNIRNVLSELFTTGFTGANGAEAFVRVGFGASARSMPMGFKTMKTSLKFEATAGEAIKVSLDFVAFTS